MISLGLSHEFQSALEKKGITISRVLIGFNCVIPILALTFLTFNLSLVSIMLMVCLQIGIMYTSKRKKSGASKTIRYFSLLHLFWIVVPVCLFYQIRVMEDGYKFVFYLILCSTVGDSFAYYIGKNFGKIKLSKTISPNKTLEGFVASFFSSVIICTLFLLWNNILPFPEAIILSMFINVSSQVGDLAESKFKRYCGIKDTSTLIPGHGGLLDRLDTYLFSVPMLFLLLFYLDVI